MTDLVARLSTCVDNLAAALDGHTSALADVATSLRNHPASTTDNGKLSALADRIDNITNSLNTSTADLHSLAAEQVNDVPSSDAPVTEPDVGAQGEAVAADGGDANPTPDASSSDSSSTDTSGSSAAPETDSTQSSGDAGSTDTGVAGDGTLTAPVENVTDGSAPEADTASGDGFQQPQQ